MDEEFLYVSSPFEGLLLWFLITIPHLKLDSDDLYEEEMKTRNTRRRRRNGGRRSPE